jgi:hypothetical protein
VSYIFVRGTRGDKYGRRIHTTGPVTPLCENSHQWRNKGNEEIQNKNSQAVSDDKPALKKPYSHCEKGEKSHQGDPTVEGVDNSLVENLAIAPEIRNQNTRV